MAAISRVAGMLRRQDYRNLSPLFDTVTVDAVGSIPSRSHTSYSRADVAAPMTLLQILLILGAAFGFVTLDLLRKVLAERMRLVPLLFWMTAGVIPLYGLWALNTGAEVPSSEYWPPAIASIALNVAANLFYLRAVHVGELSRTIPLLSLTPVLTALFAVPLLQEVPAGLQVVGILLVVGGALLLQVGAGPDSEDDVSSDQGGSLQETAGQSTSETTMAAKRWWHRLPRSAWLMLAVACLWSATTPLDKLALRGASVPLHALILHLGIAASLLVWLLVP